MVYIIKLILFDFSSFMKNKIIIGSFVFSNSFQNDACIVKKTRLENENVSLPCHPAPSLENCAVGRCVSHGVSCIWNIRRDVSQLCPSSVIIQYLFF